VKAVAEICLNPYPEDSYCSREACIFKNERGRHWVMTVTLARKRFHLVSFRDRDLSIDKPAYVIHGEEYYAICYEGRFYNAGDAEGKLISKALQKGIIPEAYILVYEQTKGETP
jgi:hypothetical protein